LELIRRVYLLGRRKWPSEDFENGRKQTWRKIKKGSE
jgi:hypothetical protein